MVALSGAVHEQHRLLELKVRRGFPRAEDLESLAETFAILDGSRRPGGYLQLQMARASVEQRITSSEAREQFVDHLRAHLAKTIEYGQPLEPVHLKTRAEPALEKTQNRDLMPQR